MTGDPRPSPFASRPAAAWMMAGLLALAPLAIPALAAAPARHAPAAPAAATSSARLEVAPLEVVASPQMIWNLEMRLVNEDALGLYVDSVRCRAEDTGPGETHAPRVSTFGIPPVAQDVSGADSSFINQSMPATFEQGTLVFELFGHRSDGRKVAIHSATITARPGPMSEEHPSEFVEVGGKKVEVVLFRSQKDSVGPGLLLVHDGGSHARQMIPLGLRLSLRGYTVLTVSMPGFGLSEGPADFAGPRSVAALGAALDRLKRTAGVDSARIGAWGVGRGAGALASLAAQRRDLVAAVAQAGIYDLWATSRGTAQPELRAAIVAEAGRDSSAWGERSPIGRAGAIHSSMLLIHGEADRDVPVGQARAFADALTRAGVTVETRFVAGADHALQRGDVQRSATQFLDGKLKH